jgi:type IV fimbrial biogenesis protein FimT
MRLCNKQSGFTLIEMMIIIAILAIFAAIAVPNFLSYLPKSRLNGAARQVMGDLMAARMNAVSQNCDATVTFASGNPEYEIEIWTDSDNDDIKDPGEVTTQKKNLHPHYYDVIISSTNSIIFSSRGTASSFDTIDLINTAGLTKKVKVRITGSVKIE